MSGTSPPQGFIGVARPLEPFALGFDCLAVCSDAMLQEATARGFKAVGRYVQTLSVEEVARIHSYGFPILVYTEAMTRTALSAQTGQQYGDVVRQRCKLLRMPTLVHVGLDLEDPAPGSNAGAHVNTMGQRLALDGRPSALYVGAPPPELTSAEIFELVPARYIKGAGRLIERDGIHPLEPACGWAAIQLEPLEGVSLAGEKVDVWVSKSDYMGRLITAWAPA